MAITKGCEGEVLIVSGGAPVEIENLISFGMSSSTSTESIAVLNNNCINKNSVTSKEVTGSMEGCWDCDDIGQSLLKCGETVEVYWYPKGQAPTPTPANGVPLWHGRITLSSYDLASNAEDAVTNFTSDFVLDEVITTNLPF